MKLWDAKAQVYERNSFTYPLSCICFHFVRKHHDYTSSKEALKVCKQSFFQEIWAKSSVTCNLPVQLRFIDVVLSTA